MTESPLPREQPQQMVNDMPLNGSVPAMIEDNGFQDIIRDPESDEDDNDSCHINGSPKRRDPQLGQLVVHGDYNFNIPTQQGAQDYVEEYHGKTSWRWKALDFLHQKRVQYTLMGLLLLDVLILFIELFLLTQYPLCSMIKRDCVSCCPHDTDDQLRLLAGKDDEYADVCEADLEPNYNTGGCDPHKWDKAHKAEKVFFSLTIVILALFFIELNVEMIVLRPSIFFRQFFYTMDYFIVLISLVSELSLHFASRDNYAALVGFIVFVRIWRFVRIGHGIIEVTAELTHRKYEKLLAYAGELEAVIKHHNLKRPRCPNSVQKALDKHASDSHHTVHSESAL